MRKVALIALALSLTLSLSGCFWLLLGAAGAGGAVAYHEYDKDHWPCPNCGVTVARDDQFCGNCSEPVVPVDEQEARAID